MAASELEPRLQLAIAAAREAGALTMRYYQTSTLTVELKSDSSPVTIADREAESLLRNKIAEFFPKDAILGEEFPERTGTSGFRWILDPIDGTKSFIHGVPLFGTLIGVEQIGVEQIGGAERAGGAVVGVIYLAALDELIYAARGFGAWHSRGGRKPERAQVNATATLSESLFCTSDPAGYRALGRQSAYDQLQSASRLSRSWGDCYGYVLVATGRAELMVDPALNVWDAAALQPILEEAGGTFTDWRGTATIHAGEAIATNGRVFDEAIAITRAFGR